MPKTAQIYIKKPTKSKIEIKLKLSNFK